MSQTYGIESPRKYTEVSGRERVHYLIVIDSDGMAIARLFRDKKTLLAEFDASVPEVAQMTQGMVPAKGALGEEWDDALRGHSMAERASADVYTLKM